MRTFNPHSQHPARAVQAWQILVGKAMNRPTRHDLDQALQTILAGGTVQEPSTRAIGCSLADIK